MYCEQCKKERQRKWLYQWRKREGRGLPGIIPGRTMYALAGLVELPTNKFLDVVQRQISGEDLIRGSLR